MSDEIEGDDGLKWSSGDLSRVLFGSLRRLRRREDLTEEELENIINLYSEEQGEE